MRNTCESTSGGERRPAGSISIMDVPHRAPVNNVFLSPRETEKPAFKGEGERENNGTKSFEKLRHKSNVPVLAPSQTFSCVMAFF